VGFDVLANGEIWKVITVKQLNVRKKKRQSFMKVVVGKSFSLSPSFASSNC
jgi:hypothetical protein